MNEERALVDRDKEYESINKREDMMQVDNIRSRYQSFEHID